MNSALEEYLASLPADDWRALAARVRPPDEAPKGDQVHDHLAGINGHSDPADRRRALMASIGDKQRRLLPEHTDANGHRIDPNDPKGGSVNYVSGKVNIGNLPPGAYPTHHLHTKKADTNDT